MTKKKNFTGIPLQCRKLAGVFDEKFKPLYQSADPASMFQLEMNYLGHTGDFVTESIIIERKVLRIME